MGRYGHHNNHNRYQKRDDSQDVQIKRKPHDVFQDWDSSRPQRPERVEQDWESSNEQSSPSIVDRIKERYQKYNSIDARMERRNNEIVKRKRKIEDLSYNSKKESLKADIRKSKQVAPLFSFGGSGAINQNKQKKQQRSNSSEGTMSLPRQNFGSMDRMFGIGNNQPVKRQAKPKSNGWANMDRMLGGY